MVDVTELVEAFCASDGRDGLVNVFVPHATAGVALMVRSGPSTDDLGKPGAGGATVVASAGATNEDPSGVEIENVESTDNAVSVFYLPAAAAGANLNASSVVVWITDEPPPSGDL